MTADPATYSLTGYDLAGRDDDPTDPTEDRAHLSRVAALARTFPSLATAPVYALADEFDPDAFDSWASSDERRSRV